MSLILTKDQASAAYSAMSALNTAGSSLVCDFGTARIGQLADGAISISQQDQMPEWYDRPSDFAVAYGLPA